MDGGSIPPGSTILKHPIMSEEIRGLPQNPHKTRVFYAFRILGVSELSVDFRGQLSFRPDFIEHQLAHAVRDPNGRAYNRTAHLAERRKMMQAWADYLDKLKNGADVIPILKAG